MSYRIALLSFALVVSFAALSAGAEEEPAQSSESTIVQADSLNLVFASTLETKLTWNHTVTIPFLRASGPLFSGNNLRLKTMAEVAPVSLNAKLDVAFTPIAFLQFYGQAGIGSGWNLPIATGLALNTEETADAPEGEPFEGAVWFGRFGGTFQFDMAALLPGDWNHVVVQVSQGMRYRANTAAAPGEAWYWENNAGESLNGWTYQATYVLGYQMPVMVNLIALLAECDINLYKSPGGDLWGESEAYWVFGPVVNAQPLKNLSLALIAQARTRRNFTAGTADDPWYRSRVLDTTNPWRIEFYRVALNATLSL